MKPWSQRALLSERPLLPKPLSGEEVPLTKVALYVELKAKSERAEEVAEFLASAQPLAQTESATVALVFNSFRPDHDRPPQH